MTVNLYENFRVNSPHVVSETIEGEAIIMHHGSGYYFNATGPGALIWQAVEQAAARDAIVARLTSAFEVGEAEARAAVGRFLETLESHDLVRRGGEPGLDDFTPPAARAAFAEPVIEVHTDLADMLLLDPIHDVDEAGWPARAARPQTP